MMCKISFLFQHPKIFPGYCLFSTSLTSTQPKRACSAHAERYPQQSRPEDHRGHSDNCSHQMPGISIPSHGLSDLQRQVYESLLSSIPMRALPVVVITDIAKDYDDMAALLILAELHRLQHIELRAVVANLMPAHQRAKVAKRTLDLLGLREVQVGIGTKACVKDHDVHAYEFCWEEESIGAMRDEDFLPGETLLYRTYRAAQQAGEKIAVVCLSSLTDINQFATTYEDLFSSTTASCQIQGASQVIDGHLVPHQSIPAANNFFDPAAAKHFHALIQRGGIQSTTFTKHAAFALPLPDDIFRQLAETRTSIGAHLDWLHFEITKQFYADSVHNPYRADITPQVVLKARTTWYDTHHDGAAAKLPRPDDLRPYLKRPLVYDAIAALGVLSEEALDGLANVGQQEWGICRPFTPDMRGGIHAEVGRADETAMKTFHPERVSLIITALLKGVLLATDVATI